METIGLVACGAKKRPDFVAAELLYISDLFQKSRQYVRENCDRWFILSSKHGLLLPQTAIDPYEATLKNIPEDRHAAWANSVTEAIRANTRTGDRLIFLAGRDYHDRIIAELKPQGYHIEVPMQGLDYDTQVDWLTKHIARQTDL